MSGSTNGLSVGRRGWCWLVVLVLVILVPFGSSLAQERRGERDRELDREGLVNILEGLEHGMVALKKLGRSEEFEALQRLANGIRRRLEQAEGQRKRGEDERAVARRQLEIIRSAKPALLEAGRKDTAELLQKMIRAREVGLEGRRDEEAREIRTSAPKLGAQVEILNYAAKLWDEFGHEGKAGALRELAKAMWAGRERRQAETVARDRRERPQRQKRRQSEREVAKQQIDVMKMALHAFQEADKPDATDLMKRAIQARIVALEGMRGKEAKIVRERAPKHELQVELLASASRLWREFGNADKAEAVGRLAEEMSGQQRRRQAAANRDDRVERLERMIGELEKSLRECKNALREIGRER